MARQMMLFLVRHGETVDNVAQLYAGSRDSALTNHGYQQATRLGLHFADLGLTFTHLFSSHLQRAVKTAGLIRDAQILSTVADGSTRIAPDVIQLPVLMEQDFGFYEGKKWNVRSVNGKHLGSEHHRQPHKNPERCVDIESKESLARRADTFLDGHLLPLLDSATENLVVAVVSHGIMLSALWKRLLSRLPEKSVTLAPELASSPVATLEHLSAWSNTGYVELRMTRSWPDPAASATAMVANLQVVTSETNGSLPSPANASAAQHEVAFTVPSVLSPSGDASKQSQLPATVMKPESRKLGHDWSVVIHMINGKDHLKGLKRTGGGLGSSRHDASQKKIDSFFKRRKVD